MSAATSLARSSPTRRSISTLETAVRDDRAHGPAELHPASVEAGRRTKACRRGRMATLHRRRRRRIVTLDIIRGVAVMGIFSVNVVAFAMIEAAYFNPAAYGGHDHARTSPSGPANFVLIDGKMRGLFSMLFGASMLLVIERAEAAGEARLAGAFSADGRAARCSASLHYLSHLVRRHPALYAVVGPDRLPVRAACRPSSWSAAALRLPRCSTCFWAPAVSSRMIESAAARHAGRRWRPGTNARARLRRSAARLR